MGQSEPMQEAPKLPPSTAAERDARRKQYFEEYSDRVDRHRQGAAYYESRAIDFALNALKVLAYLNGGGLIAIPAAVCWQEQKNGAYLTVSATLMLVALAATHRGLLDAKS